MPSERDTHQSSPIYNATTTTVPWSVSRKSSLGHFIKLSKQAAKAQLVFIYLLVLILPLFCLAQLNMTTLPVVDLEALSAEVLPNEATLRLSKELAHVFETTGFAYLTNTPLSFDHAETFTVAKEFFGLPLEEKMKCAKISVRRLNRNTYRGCVIRH